jgi:hypothetical protein
MHIADFDGSKHQKHADALAFQGWAFLVLAIVLIVAGIWR